MDDASGPGMPDVRTVWHEDGRVFIVDQTLLPAELKVVEVVTPEQMWEAIRALRVRGAPAIGVAAAFGVWLAVKQTQPAHPAALAACVDEACEYLATARPTAVNLFWGLERMRRALGKLPHLSVDQQINGLLAEAAAMIAEDDEVCLAIGRHGAPLLADGARVLTHCNAGGLCTTRYGTALSVIYWAVGHEGKSIEVYADETRPLLQGARLTAWELHRAGIPVTLICDNMAASLMARGRIDAVIVGTDRVAANGDFANKIGTYGVAVLARHHGIPFYVAAPISSIDVATPDGAAIPIEERDGDEVAFHGGVRMAPEGVRIYNPAFDVTPAEFVTAFVTERGLLHPPFGPSIAQLFVEANQ